MVVLNVDDDKDNLDIFCEAIKEVDPDIDFLQAQSASEALEILHHTSALPDYVFLDMHMPCMDGRTCLKRIKDDHYLDTITVVMYSSSDNLREIAECRKLGATFLKKQNSHQRLVNSLKRIFESKRIANETIS